VCVALIGLYGAFPTMAKKDKVLFIQQDKVVHLQFIPLDGFEGAQTGTATGEINASICLEYLANLDLSLRVRRVGQRVSHSMASSFDFTCHSQKPAISSFVSAKGPSITVRFASENLKRAPCSSDGVPRPLAARRL
jgi:hypothetical protein